MANPRDPIESTWCGVAKFACPFCAFDSLQRDRVTFHIEHDHPLPPPVETPVKPTKGTKA